MINLKNITEISKTGVTFTFGRFNPPTVGHVKLAAKMKEKAGTDDILIFTSHTTDKKKNPLTNAQIRKFMNPMLPRGINVVSTASRTIFDVLTSLYDDGYRQIQMVVGSDRVMEFQKLLKKYNGIKSRHGLYNFESIKVVTAGDRDPDAEGAAGMSASKMRQFVHAGQEKEFIKALPTGYRLGKQLYKAVQTGMGITEDYPDFMYEIYNPSVHQWGTEKGREYAQSITPCEPVVKWIKKSVKETEELPKKVLLYKEKMYKELKSERDDFVKRYGDRADEVMHATAMTMAKRKYGYS
jgi:nicotinamide mononucleotide adenylyltransferase